MTTAITITTSSRLVRRAVEKLLKASQTTYSSFDEFAAYQPMAAKDLSAEDYRQMIRRQAPTIKAKSFQNYEG